MTRLLITGIAGFVGQWLTRELLAARKSYRIIGAIQLPSDRKIVRSLHPDIPTYLLDLTDPQGIRRVVQKVRPDMIVHLAARSSVGQSFGTEQETLQVNLIGTQHLLDAVRETPVRRLLFVSSSDVFGSTAATGKKLTESDPLAPISPYAISKAAAEWACLYAARQYQTPVVIARSFNHTGPGQTDRFVIPSFARQIAEIEAGRKPPVIQVGDLSAKRDFSDVRDVVRAYRLLLEKGKAGEIYQVCSGTSRSIESVLRSLLAYSPGKIRIEVDKRRLRKADIPVIAGSSARLRRLGWKRSVPFSRTLQETLAWWRLQV